MTWFNNSEGRYGASGAKGDLGEQIVEQFCVKNDIPFISFTDDVNQVIYKIDCFINNIPVDIKANYNNGRLVVELYHTRKKSPGWLYTTYAEQIYGVDTASKSIYRYNIRDMKSYVNKHKERGYKSRSGDILLYVPVSQPFIERIQ
jgi:hypothetical protein